MADSLSTQLHNLDFLLRDIACETTGDLSGKVMDLARTCGYLSGLAAIAALKKTEPAYADITKGLKDASDAAAKADAALKKVGQDIAVVAKAVDTIARIIETILKLLAL